MKDSCCVCRHKRGQVFPKGPGLSMHFRALAKALPGKGRQGGLGAAAPPRGQAEVPPSAGPLPPRHHSLHRKPKRSQAGHACAYTREQRHRASCRFLSGKSGVGGCTLRNAGHQMPDAIGYGDEPVRGKWPQNKQQSQPLSHELRVAHLGTSPPRPVPVRQREPFSGSEQ